ncbi:response regulator transcription factor [Acetobacter estunensis]|uniref:response regulator transcription factor n=1 Tax=Acetobacter estunensis TaxID=104097 RepID=UPI001C2DA45F|nr:response regulator transcription factor [Acetobacter estunensis]MBV1838720.1 response regulator transcription factor [Acetobacter estunensis]
MRLLLIEDEADLAAAVAEHVRENGYAVDHVDTLDAARAALAVVTYDVILMDLGLPDGSSRQLLRELRHSSHRTAILITTAEDQISDRIAGLSEGADDYIVKPFDLDELVARITAVNRRRFSSNAPLLRIGSLVIDRDHGVVVRNGKPVQLTAREWAVLELLSRHPGAVHSREQIETALYDFNGYTDSNAVEVFISRLRKKLGADSIQTLRGRGYALTNGEAT